MGRLTTISTVLTAVGTCTLAGVTVWGIFLSDFGEVLVSQLRSDIADAREELVNLKIERRILVENIERYQEEMFKIESDVELLKTEKESLKAEKLRLEDEKKKIFNVIYTEYVFEMSQCLSVDMIMIETAIMESLDKIRSGGDDIDTDIKKIQNIDGWDLVFSLLSDAPRPYLYDLVYFQIVSDVVDFMVQMDEVFFNPIWPDSIDVSDLPKDVADLLLEDGALSAEREAAIKGLRALGNVQRLERALEELLRTIHPNHESLPIVSVREVDNNLISSPFCIVRGLRKRLHGL